MNDLPEGTVITYDTDYDWPPDWVTPVDSSLVIVDGDVRERMDDFARALTQCALVMVMLP